MAAGEESSERMMDEEEAHKVRTKTKRCAKPPTLTLFFIVSILLNMLLVSVILGLLLAGNLLGGSGDKGSVQRTAGMDEEVPVARGSMDQICIQCDPGEGVKTELLALYPVNNGTNPLCCKQYNDTAKTTGRTKVGGVYSQDDVQRYLTLDGCTHISAGRPLPAALVFMDLTKSSGNDLQWSLDSQEAYLQGGVTLSNTDSYSMLRVPDGGLYVVYSDLEFHGRFDVDKTPDKTSMHVHSLVKIPAKVVQMHRFTLRNNDIKKSAAITVLDLQAGDAIFVAVNDISYIYDTSTTNRFGLYKLR